MVLNHQLDAALPDSHYKAKNVTATVIAAINKRGEATELAPLEYPPADGATLAAAADPAGAEEPDEPDDVVDVVLDALARAEVIS